MEIDNVPGNVKSLMKPTNAAEEAQEALTQFFKTSESGQKILTQLTDTVTAAFQQNSNVETIDERILKLNEVYQQLVDKQAQPLAKTSEKEQAILEDNKAENGILRKRESMDVDDMEQKRFKDSSKESMHLSDNGGNQ